MAIQKWTIIKLVGPAATDATVRFNGWLKKRRSSDDACVSQSDWPVAIRRTAATYLSRLIDHRIEMPIAYFNEHVDLWSSSGQIALHLGKLHPQVWHDTGQLWCYQLPDRGRLVRHNNVVLKKAQFPESEWLATRLIEAARAYDKLWPQATLLVNRHALTASPSDEELKENAGTFPKWLGRTVK